MDTMIACKNESEWLQERSKGIGASEAAVVLGLNPNRSPLELYLQKRGLLKSQDTNIPMRVGHALEPIVCELYEEETGNRLIDHGRYTIYRSPEHQYISCTLDREIEAKNGSGPGAFEAKAIGVWNAGEWADEDGEPQIPVHYRIQNQLQMYVMGWKWGVVSALIGNTKLVHVRQERNEDFITALIDRLYDFWWRVENGVPPDPDNTVSCKEAIKKLYPKDNGETVELGEDYIASFRLLKELKEQKKDIESQIDGIENRIKFALGDAAVGIIPGTDLKFSYKTQTRKGYTVEPGEMRVLRVSGKE